MKDRKKQATAVVMATTLALTTAIATSATPVYAQGADETAQTESIISDDSNTEIQETDTIIDEETTEDTGTSTQVEDEISDDDSKDDAEISDNTITSIIQKVMTLSIENDEDNGISTQAEGDVEINETNFPDALFREYIKTNFDTDKDGSLSKEEVNAVTEINVNGKTAITSLQGIEHFPALVKLNCNNTGIASLDVSKNTALENLLCNNTNITSLDVSSNLSLRELNCQSTKITSIEGLEQLVSLKYLYCNDTSIKELDISKNILLENLYCYNTDITELDVSKNTALKHLRCYNTSISELDISNNTALNYLYCYSTDITELDVSQNTALKYLFCDDTNITELDVSKNTALQYLSCYDTAITELDVSKNTALEYLACYNTSITELNVSNNTALRTLYCYKTDITELDVSKNELLSLLYCNNTPITELDVSNNKKLTGLYIYNTSITSIDLSQNEALTTLHCDSTPIMELDVSNNKKLSWLSCGNSNLTSLDVSQNTALTTLSCRNANLAYLNIGDNSNLTYVAKNDISIFNITGKVGSSFDITEMFKGIDVSKITIKSEDVTMTDGIVNGYTTDDPVVVYEYDCGTANGTEHTLTITLNLTLKDSRTITWNENSLNKTYDKKPVAITESAYSVSAGNGDVSFSYQKQNADGTWGDLENAPVSAGTYRVQATVEEDEDYSSATTDWKEFAISKATPEYTVPANLTATYGQTLGDIELPTGFTWQNDTSTLVGNAGSNSFKVVYTPDDTENYNTVNDIDVTVVVSQTTNNWTEELSITGWTYGEYDEDKNAPSATAKYGEVTYTYSDNENGNFTEDVPTEAGTWYVKATVAETDNYAGLTATKSFTISQATNSWTDDISITGWTYGEYDEDKNAPSATAKYGEVTYTYSDNENGNFTEDVPTEAGTWYVKATVAETDNYAGLTATKSFTISQATNSWTDDISITGWTYGEYDEDKNAPSATAKYGEVTYTYSDSENGNFTEDVPTEAGTWYVKATVAETSNYTELTATKSFVIEQAVPQFDMPNNLTATYGDTLSSVELPEYDNGTLKWKDDAQSVGKAGTNTFEAVFMPNDTENYRTVTVNVSVSVGKAVPAYTVPTGIVIGQGKTLDSVALTNGFSWKDGNTVASELGIHSFEAFYTPDDTDNYETAELTISVEVVPALTPINQIPSITAGDKTLTVGDTFNPLDGVTATDTEDGDLTDEVEIISNDVDISKAGTYTVTYKVTDSQGASSTKTITVTVREKEDTDNPSDEQKPNDDGNDNQTNSGSNSGNTADTSNNDKSSTSQNSTGSDSSPQTGDMTNTGVWGTLLALSGGFVAFLAGKRRKSKYSDVD